MAGEIQVATTTGKTVDAIVRNSVGQVLTISGLTFGAYATANRANYLISLTEQGTASGFYAGTMPAVPLGIYSVTAYARAVAGTPAESDPVAAAGTIEWDGSAVCGASSANVTRLNGSTTPAANLAAAYAGYETGTAQAGGASSITLRSGASATTDFFKNQAVWILSGTGAGQSNRITAYNGGTKVATVETAWATQPDNTSVYAVLGRVQ